MRRTNECVRSFVMRRRRGQFVMRFMPRGRFASPLENRQTPTAATIAPHERRRSPDPRPPRRFGRRARAGQAPPAHAASDAGAVVHALPQAVRRPFRALAARRVRSADGAPPRAAQARRPEDRAGPAHALDALPAVRGFRRGAPRPRRSAGRAGGARARAPRDHGSVQTPPGPQHRRPAPSAAPPVGHRLRALGPVAQRLPGAGAGPRRGRQPVGARGAARRRGPVRPPPGTAARL